MEIGSNIIPYVSPEEFSNVIEENKKDLILDATTKALVRDIVRVYTIDIERKKEKEIRDSMLFPRYN